MQTRFIFLSLILSLIPKYKADSRCIPKPICGRRGWASPGSISHMFFTLDHSQLAKEVNGKT